MTTFFISDTHFLHSNAIKYCDRPFSSVEEMNETMILNWNSKIGSEDVVYHLGDFSINSRNHEKNKEKEKDLKKILNRLNGRKFLIYGNHDADFLDFYRDFFYEVLPYKEIQIDNKIWSLFHYPIEDWNGKWSDAGIHLHGHSHGKSENKKNRLDVGVDCHNFFPISLEEIKIKINI